MDRGLGCLRVPGGGWVSSGGGGGRGDVINVHTGW